MKSGCSRSVQLFGREGLCPQLKIASQMREVPIGSKVLPCSLGVVLRKFDPENRRSKKKGELERTIIMQTKIFALAALLCSTALAAVEDTYEPADSKVNVSTGLRSLGLTIPHYFPVTLPV